MFILVASVLMPWFLSAQGLRDSKTDEILGAYNQRRALAETRQELRLVKLKKLYHEALAGLAEESRTGGEFENFVKVEAEIKRSERSMISPEKLSDFPPLEKLQQILIRQLAEADLERARELAGLYEQLDQALSLRQKQLLQEGNVNGAKQLQAVRDRQAEDLEVVAAKALAAKVAVPVLQVPGLTSNNLTLANVQSLLNGIVTSFNPLTREIEVLYDFESQTQLKDFRISMEDHFKIENGRLVVSSPPGSDWWVAYPQPKCPYLIVPYLEAMGLELQVTMLSLEAEGEYHVAVGVSDLGQKTLGFGPLSVTKGFTPEGWTPKRPQARGKSAKVPLAYPVTLSVRSSSKQVLFGIEGDRREDEIGMDTDGSLIHAGFFPKSWGEKGARAVYDPLRVKGRLKADFGK